MRKDFEPRLCVKSRNSITVRMDWQEKKDQVLWGWKRKRRVLKERAVSGVDKKWMEWKDGYRIIDCYLVLVVLERAKGTVGQENCIDEKAAMINWLECSIFATLLDRLNMGTRRRLQLKASCLINTG